MEIKDIKFHSDSVYLLKTCEVTLDKFEETVEKFDYNTIYAKYKMCKDEVGVEKVKFPHINFAFYKYLFERDEVPSPEEILVLYFDLYKQHFKVIEEQDTVYYKNKKYSLKALKARVLRTYPSLIRDFHFYLMLKKENIFDKVTYSCADDINGKDITVIYKDEKYIVSLYTNTRRAQEFKKIKNEFRHKYGKNEIKIPLDFDNAYDCGTIKLYPQKDVEYVKETILNKESESTVVKFLKKLWQSIKNRIS